MLKPFSLNRINRSTYNQLAVDGEINADALYSVVEENGSSSLYWGTKPAVQGTGQLKPVFCLVHPYGDYQYSQNDFWANLADESVPVGFRILVCGPFGTIESDYNGSNTGIGFFEDISAPYHNYYEIRTDDGVETVYIVEKGPDSNPIIEIVGDGSSVRILMFEYMSYIISYEFKGILTFDEQLTTIDCGYYTEGPLLEPGIPE